MSAYYTDSQNIALSYMKGSKEWRINNYSFAISIKLKQSSDIVIP